MPAIRRPTNWGSLRTNEAEQIIRGRAQDTNKIIIIGHPVQRGQERDLATDIVTILRNGCVTKEPEKNAHGDWEVEIARRTRGERYAAVVTIVPQEDDTLIVKTVKWNDP